MSRGIAFLLSFVVFFAWAASAEDYAPGRVIVKIEPHAAEGWFADGDTGYRDLDHYLYEIEVLKIRRLAKARNDDLHHALRERFGTDGILAIQYGVPLDPDAVASRLGRLPGVIYAHPDYYAQLLATPNDPFFNYQYAMSLMQMPQAWDEEKGSEEVVIGISDTGTDWNHPDLMSNIWINEAEDYNGNGMFDNFPVAMGGDFDGLDADGNGYVDDVIGWDFITAEEVAEDEDGFPPDPDPMDCDGHGTCTAGIAGAVTDNDLMVAGTAWHCKLMPLKTFYKTMQGNATAVASDIVESFYYAADNEVDVLSMSWRSPDSEALHEAISYAHAAGVFLVSSAGNESSESPAVPAMYPEVLAVAATQQQDMKASFSNYGEWIGVAAPGVDIWTTSFNDSYTGGFGGTSASCPYVAGVAGLIRSLFPAISNEEIYYRLMGTTDEIDALNPEYRGKLGSGRMNGYRALTEQPHPTLRLVEIAVDDTLGGNGDGLLGPGETANISFKLRNYWQSSTDVTGYLSTIDPQVVVDTTQAIPFGAIETDSIVGCSANATVSVSIDAEIGYLVEFRLTLETNEGYIVALPFRVPMASQMFADIAPAMGLPPAASSITAAFADFDLDGDVDFYRSAWSTDHGLYRNDGDSLTNVTDEWGLPMTGRGQGAAWGDYDNDGDPDLIHGTMDGMALFRNDGLVSGFTDVTGVAGILSDEVQGFAVSWGDYDGDGWLDLYVAHQRQQNQLFKNNGDGTFIERGAAAGVNSESVSYGASWADFDRDGDLDLFVANYGTPWQGLINEFFVNQGDGTFLEDASTLGLGDEALVSTGGVWGDYDADGWLDLYVTNMSTSGQPNRLFRNIRGKGFVRQIDSGIEDPRSSSSAAWGDFDGDGLLDLYVCNRQRNSLYRNLGDGVFGDATESATVIDMGYVVVWVDLDGDGDEDIYVGKGGGDQILCNLYNPESSLYVHLEGSAEEWGSSTDGMGARVTLCGDGSRLTRVIGEGCGLGQGNPTLTLPLAAVGSNPILHVEWPGGTIQRVEVPGPGELIVEEERAGVDLALRAVALPFDLSHGEATIQAEVTLQDNGTTPLLFYGIRLEVMDDDGTRVYVDSVVIEDPVGADVRFHGVPAPDINDVYTYLFMGEATGDEAAWNNEKIQILTGGQPLETFERPPVYWNFSSEWRWARSGPQYQASSGIGLLLLSPGGPGEPSATSPDYGVESGTLVGLRFMTMYSLDQDTVYVTAWQDQEQLARMAISGSQDFYSEETLTFNVEASGEVRFTWNCTRSDSTDPGWFLAIDDVELVVLAPAEDAHPLPIVLQVHGPWPNPSSGEMTWRLHMPGEAPVLFEVYDMAGRRIRREALGTLRRGMQSIAVSPASLGSGVYLARFSTVKNSCTRLFVRLK